MILWFWTLSINTIIIIFPPQNHLYHQKRGQSTIYNLFHSKFFWINQSWLEVIIINYVCTTTIIIIHISRRVNFLSTFLMQQFSIIDYVCTTTIKSTYETHYHENVYTYPSFNEPSTSLTLSATENYHQPWKNKSLHQDESVSLRLFTTLNNMSMSLVGPLNRSFGTDQLTLDLLYFSLTNAQPNPYDNF